MTPRSSPTRFDLPQRWPLLALVLLLHVGLLWWWSQSQHFDGAQRSRPAVQETGRILLRLFPRPSTSRSSTSTQPTPAMVRTAPISAAPRSAKHDEASSPPQSAVPAPPAAELPTAITPPPAPAVALDLRLPRAASAPPSPATRALGDARSNSPRKGFGDRLAVVLSNDEHIIEERMQGEGRMRVRQGANCVEVHQARSAQLDPFNGSTRPTPSGVKSCE